MATGGRKCLSLDMLCMAVKTDVQQLIREFASQKCLDFSVFRELWRDNQMSLLHLTDFLPFVKRRDVTHLIFGEFLKFVRPKPNEARLIVRIGGLYGLYLAHETQVSPQRVPIRLDLDLADSIAELALEANDRGILDAAAVFKAMYGGGFFAPVAATLVPTLATAHHARQPPIYESLLGFSNGSGATTSSSRSSSDKAKDDVVEFSDDD
jgi:Small nuclear RNA activating complex (SNAPc), subunit 1